MSEDGAPGLAGLTHIVLLAGSPPGPEPMEDAKRQAMLAWFAGDADDSRAEAHGFIADNVAMPLHPDLHGSATEDVLRAERAAWIAWLEAGSREDWSSRIGRLETPALIVAGAQDEALGAKAQAGLMAPHFASARLHTLPGTGHLLPLEQPAELARLIGAFLDETRPREPAIDPDYLALIGSDRVSARTRDILLRRAEPLADADPDLLDMLRAVTDRLIPQDGPARIDIAARILDAIDRTPGDGWRFADLPPDAEALRRGLLALEETAQRHEGVGLAGLDGDRLDALIASLSDPAPSDGDDMAGDLTPAQRALWFQDLRAAAVQAYLAHPATLARIGYSGIANRGEASGPQGFVRVGMSEREPWEPQSKAGPAR